jgi:hypothetical protein
MAMHTVFTAEGTELQGESRHGHQLDEFDVDTVPVRTIDGKSLW